MPKPEVRLLGTWKSVGMPRALAERIAGLAVEATGDEGKKVHPWHIIERAIDALGAKSSIVPDAAIVPNVRD